MLRTLAVVAALLAAGALAGCSGKAGHTFVTMDTSKGRIVLELEDDKSPITVDNFRKYVRDGFYDNTLFHRIVKDFMIQGGGLDAETGQEKPSAYPMVKNEARVSGLKNLEYTISMARTTNPDSATNQFFINTKNNPSLDPTPNRDGYAAFGKVVLGTDVVDAIESTPVAYYAPEHKFCRGDPRQPELSCPKEKVVILTVVLGHLGPADAPTTPAPTATTQATTATTSPTSDATTSTS